MQTITIKIDDEKRSKLQKKADKIGIKIEDFINITLDDFLYENETDLENKINYIFNKNNELYERLAKWNIWQ